jgi:hypothetical protein
MHFWLRSCQLIEHSSVTNMTLSLCGSLECHKIDKRMTLNPLNSSSGWLTIEMRQYVLGRFWSVLNLITNVCNSSDKLLIAIWGSDLLLPLNSKFHTDRDFLYSRHVKIPGSNNNISLVSLKRTTGILYVLLRRSLQICYKSAVFYPLNHPTDTVAK